MIPQASWLSNNIKPILALVIAISAILFLFMIVLISNDNSIRGQALVAMVTLVSGVSGYYFGYSQGASKKDEADAQAKSVAFTTSVSNGGAQ